MAELERQLKAQRGELADLGQQAAALRQQVEGGRAQLASLEARRSELQNALRSLQEQQTAPAATVAPAAAQPAGTAPAAGQGTATRAANVGSGAAGPAGLRAQTEITRALRLAPGLSTASAAEFDQLASLLQNGACVTDALHEVFGRINRQTLVSLLHELGGC